MRGAGHARTPNQVRRSSVPSRRPHLTGASMLACMLVLNATRTTSLILAQRTYGAANAMTLLFPRLLRRARCVYGRRGLRGLVLGPGGGVSSLVGARSSAGVYPTARLLRWRWNRHRRTNHLRSFLIRWHVDGHDDVARANTGSGSHNLDAPYLARQRCRGKLSTTNTYGTGAPCLCGTRAEGARRADRGRRAGSFYPGSGRTDA